MFIYLQNKLIRIYSKFTLKKNDRVSAFTSIDWIKAYPAGNELY